MPIARVVNAGFVLALLVAIAGCTGGTSPTVRTAADLTRLVESAGVRCITTAPLTDPLQLAAVDPPGFLFEGTALANADEQRARIEVCLVEDGDGSTFGRVVYLVLFKKDGQAEAFADTYRPVDGVTASAWGRGWAVAGDLRAVRAIAKEGHAKVEVAAEGPSDSGAGSVSTQPPRASEPATTETPTSGSTMPLGAGTDDEMPPVPVVDIEIPTDGILAPATTRSVASLCSTPLQTFQNGGVGPAFCSGGQINVRVWRAYAAEAEAVLTLGPGASSDEVVAGLCAAWANLAGGNLDDIYAMAKAYFGWSFPDDPAIRIRDPGCP
jgi:hypothetical protein